MYLEKVLLSEITLLIKRGITPAYDEIGIPVLNQKCIRDNILKFDLARITNPEKRRIPEEKYIRQWDVLVNSTGVGTLGRVAQLKQKIGKATVDSHITIVRPDLSKIDGKYFGYCMNLKQPLIEAMGEGATGQTELSRERIGEEIEISIPTLSIQREIAGILSAYDDLIDNNNRRIQILEEMAQRIYREWFVNFRYPGHENEKLVKSDLGMIPEGWKVKTIDEIALTTDYVANGSFATLKANVTLYDTPEYSLFIRKKDFTMGFSGNLKYTDKNSYDFLKKSVLYGNEFIISNVGDTGTVFRAPVWLNKPMTLGSNCILVRSESYDEYMFYYFKSHEGQHAIDSIVSGSAQPKFNKTEFRKLKVLVPVDTVNSMFKEQIKPNWELLTKLKKQLNILRKTRDLLLPKIISGKIDVSELDIDIGEMDESLQ